MENLGKPQKNDLHPWFKKITSATHCQTIEMLKKAKEIADKKKKETETADVTTNVA